MRLLAVINSFGLHLSKVHSRCNTDRQRLKRLRRRLTRVDNPLPPEQCTVHTLKSQTKLKVYRNHHQRLVHIQSDSYSINYNEEINIHIKL